MLRLLPVVLVALLPLTSALSIPQDRGPLFNGSSVVHSLDVEGYEAMLKDTESSKVVKVGAVNCNLHKEVCTREEVRAYPGVKAHHVPLESNEKVNMGTRGRVDISTIAEENKLRGNDVDDEAIKTNEALTDDISIQMKYKRLRDAGKAAMMTLENSFFIGMSVLDGERYDAAMKWVNALAASFPADGNRVAMDKLADAVKQQNSCMTTRGFKAGDPAEAWKPSDTMGAIRLYMKYFFGCEECRQHFMEANPEDLVTELAVSDPNGPHAVVMWAWKMHNSVNTRLQRDQWPSKSNCPNCYIDIGGPVSIGMSLIQEDEMVAYLTSVYGHEDKALFDEMLLTATFPFPAQGFNAIVAVTLLFALVAVALKTRRHRFLTSKETSMERQPLRQFDTSHYGAVPQSAAVSANAASNVKQSDNARDIERISRHLDNGNLGAAIDSLMAFVSVVFAGTYITNTYIPFNSLPHSIWVVELICATLFTVDFAFRGVYLAASRRQEFLLSLTTLVYLVNILPVLPASFFIRYHTFWYGESWWRFVYPVRFAMCYMTGKAVLSRCHAYLNPVRQFAFLCYLQITCILLGAAGVIQIAETMDGTLSVKNLGEWTFFNSFFNSVMTFVTIDKPPSDNDLSKIFVGVLVCIFILVIPYQISNVMDLSNSVSPYEEASYKPSSHSRHVVLCGDLTASRISHFFHEIFHNDHDFVGVHVVVLSEEPPATSLKALLLDPFFAKRVWFIQGSLLDVDDAKRAACDSASAIFMLTNRVGDEELSVSDHRTIMRVLAAKRQAPKAHIFAQLHQSVHCQLVRDMGVQNVLCLSEVTLSLLGQNCICPGFSTFMYSITSTSSFDDDNDEVDKGEGSWVDRYLLGASHEVYVVELPPASVVAGKTFSEVASLAYSHCHGIIVFAVADGPRSKVVLNPGDSYICLGGETAYVIAQTQADASALTEMSPNCTMPLAWRELQVSSPSSLVRSETGSSEGNETGAPLKRHQARFVHWQFGDYETQEPEKETEGDDHVEAPPAKNSSKSVDDAVIYDVEELGFGVAPIVICVTTESAFANDLEHLIGPLRARSLKQYHPVVIMTAKLPDDDIYEGFSHFPDVHFVIGDPYRHKTLNRAGVYDAHRVLILGTSSSTSDTNGELLQDADSIALHKFITSFIGVNKAPRVITEVGNRASVHFVAQNLLSNGWFPGSDDDNELTMFSSSETFSRNFFLSPAFTSGLTYSTSLCDSLLINQFFNDRIKKILGEFMFTSRASEAWAAIRGDKSKPELQRSSLFAVEVPQDFVGRSFEYVFHYLLSSDDILVIGLYRCHSYMNTDSEGENKARIEVPENERSVPFGYVYVNPQPFEVVTGDDLLYVLSDKQPCWAEGQDV
ncbi:hypothetical protein PHMEG_0001510 [Phytophthora megakarya]|uniref:Sulfhydryl oxidase n=1 Tax=Phytophthora megakarya TaxID=4795 RepID=A0A225X1P9_9STRA|nr:hypothetical protein PHMEG_0001510 [Phytophthora megakarya]